MLMQPEKEIKKAATIAVNKEREPVHVSRFQNPGHRVCLAKPHMGCSAHMARSTGLS
jgi:hypothetical protein